MIFIYLKNSYLLAVYSYHIDIGIETKISRFKIVENFTNRHMLLFHFCATLPPYCSGACPHLV
jgi:hypothetical protein